MSEPEPRVNVEIAVGDPPRLAAEFHGISEHDRDVIDAVFSQLDEHGFAVVHESVLASDRVGLRDGT